MTRLVSLVLVAAAALTFAGNALACVCANEPIQDRLDRADAAVVGRIVAEREGSVGGIAQRLLTVDVEQRVKGDVSGELVVRSSSGSDCDLLISNREPVGLLLTRSPDGAWLGSACSVVGAGELVAAGGEPRGGVIKVVVGVFILGLVLLWSVRRLRRGSRPDLPGAPKPP